MYVNISIESFGLRRDFTTVVRNQGFFSGKEAEVGIVKIYGAAQLNLQGVLHNPLVTNIHCFGLFFKLQSHLKLFPLCN